MKQADREQIENVIVPLVARGEISLLVGAGFSVVNENKSGRLPDADTLRDRILGKCEKIAGPKTTLRDAYLLGQKKIPEFQKYLASLFTVSGVKPWQEKIFQYAWNRIYTTNIDNVLNIACEAARRRGKIGGEYFFFNYSDPSSVGNTIGTIPVVSVHGTCLRLEDGFIFSNLDYAKASLRLLDWHRDLAAQIITGGLVVIGNQLDEADIDAHLVARETDYPDRNNGSVNWIVMPDPDEIKADNYRSSGYYVIDATAEEFFEVIYKAIAPRSIGDIVIDNVPIVRAAANRQKAMTWFKGSFSHALSQIDDAAQEKGLLRRFIMGSEPEWFYIVNEAHAEISRVGALTELIGKTLQSRPHGIGVLHVNGPSGSGKTTAIRSAIKNLSRTYKFVYEFDEGSDIDTDLLREVIGNFKDKSIFVFYSAAEYYYAVNIISDRLQDSQIPYCLFVLEDRSNEYKKNRRQLSSSLTQMSFELGDLSLEDAVLIAKKIETSGLVFENFSGLSLDRRARIIYDKEKGFGGDLLSALFSLTTNENFEDKIYREYQSIKSPLAVDILNCVAIVNSLGFNVPVDYISGFLDARVQDVAKCLGEDLAGILITPQRSSVIKCRHRIIANYYFDKCIAGRGRVDLIVGVLRFISRKFSIDDIKFHPLAYRIYKELISFEFLYERYFSLEDRRTASESTYHECQRFFGRDGIFWLHFGRFYRKTGLLDEAIECFRTGLEFYGSFQTRHMLGSTLLAKYVDDGCNDKSLYEEGVELLERERALRGSTDPYPTAGLADGLMKVIEQESTNKDAIYRLKNCINDGLRHFKDDEYFGKIFMRYVKIMNS